MCWQPLRFADIILHVDGSSLDNPGWAGFESVIRDGDSRWHGGFLGSVGVASILVAELHGIWQGLLCLLRRGVEVACCYSDSLEALRMTNGYLEEAHGLFPLVRNIVDLLEQNSGFRWFHIFREGNSVTDALAKRGANSEDFFTTWAFPPNDVKPLLSRDMAGIFLPHR